MNIQEEMYPAPDGDIRFRDVCIDCGVVINHDAWERSSVEVAK